MYAVCKTPYRHRKPFSFFLRRLKRYISGIDMNPPSANYFAKVVFKVLVFYFFTKNWSSKAVCFENLKFNPNNH